LLGQVLVASRIVRRGILAILEGEHRAISVKACDEIESCTQKGSGWGEAQRVFKEIDKIPINRSTEFVIEALRKVIIACGKAMGALGKSPDPTVTISVRQAIDSLGADPRLSRLQIQILFVSDLELVQFACGELGLGPMDPLTQYVFERLAPVHPLTLSDPRPNPEEEYR